MGEQSDLPRALQVGMREFIDTSRDREEAIAALIGTAIGYGAAHFSWRTLVQILDACAAMTRKRVRSDA